eukprot:scaffold12.g8043.t1
MGIPSKGRMAEDTLQLLKAGAARRRACAGGGAAAGVSGAPLLRAQQSCSSVEGPAQPHDCQLSVVKPNPRQYAARISQLPGVEVWFQRATDVVRKLVYGDIDLGIVGYDMLAEIGNNDPDLVVIHDALQFGSCHLALGVPMAGRFAEVHSLDDLRAMPWSEQRPLRNVYTLSPSGAGVEQHLFAAVVCVPKKQLYPAVKEIRKVGGSGVLVQPMTYIFDEEPARWRHLLATLGVDAGSLDL